VFCEDTSGIVVYLHLPRAPQSGTIKTQVEPADTREQAAEG
jgi:hypothetical protein